MLQQHLTVDFQNDASKVFMLEKYSNKKKKKENKTFPTASFQFLVLFCEKKKN